MPRLSFNVDGQRVHNYPYLQSVLQELRPSYVLVMENDINISEQLHNGLGGETKVIHRRWNKRDGNEWYDLSPEDVVKVWKAEGKPHLMRYMVNEPAYVDIADLLNWYIDLMKRAADAGFRVAVGNFAVGTYFEDQIENGDFDQFLLTLKGYEEFGHRLGIHEYTSFLLPWGVGQWTDDRIILDPDKVQTSHWPSPDDLPATRVPKRDANGDIILENGDPVMVLPPYWHLRRADWMDIRLKEEYNLDPIRKLLTECFWDDLGDLHRPPFALEGISRLYGTNGYKSLRGVNSLKAIYNRYFPALSFDEVVMEQLKWADRIYPESYESFQLFTWSPGSEWDTQWGFDMGGMDKKGLHRLMISYTQEKLQAKESDDTENANNLESTEDLEDDTHQTPTQTPQTPSGEENVWVEAFIYGRYGKTNVRRSATVASDIIGKIQPLKQIYWVNPKPVSVQGETHKWWQIAACDNAFIGWVREDVVRVDMDIELAIDALDYFKGDGRAYILNHTINGGGSEIIQTQEDHKDSRRFYHVKGGSLESPANWEELWYGLYYIYRGTDTSPGNEQLYQTSPANSDDYGYPWIKRYIRHGEWMYGESKVTFRSIATGENVIGKAPYIFKKWLRVENIYGRYMFRSGKVLENVIELAGFELDGNGNPLESPFEKYYYAKNHGLVGWWGRNVGESWYDRSFSNGGKLQRRKIGWLTLPPVQISEGAPPGISDLITDDTPTTSPPEKIVIGDAIKRIAYDVTSTFEGGSFAAYQTYDKGIISYGLFQFTLASGSLIRVVEKWLELSSSGNAEAVRSDYLDRIRLRDTSLAGDERLRKILVEAANEKQMQEAQRKTVDTLYWDRVQSVSIIPRNIQTPLGIAMAFDMAINHGILHDMFNNIENKFKVPFKSPMPSNGLDEKVFFKEMAALRHQRMEGLALARNLPGLVVRSKFWVDLIESNNWNLEGEIRVKSTTIQGTNVEVGEENLESPLPDEPQIPPVDNDKSEEDPDAIGKPEEVDDSSNEEQEEPDEDSLQTPSSPKIREITISIKVEVEDDAQYDQMVLRLQQVIGAIITTDQ